MSNKISIETVFGTLDDNQSQTLREGIKEISVHLSRMDIEKEAIKDIVASVFDETKVPKKMINRFAKVYHKQSFQEEVAQHKEFESLFEGITEVK